MTDYIVKLSDFTDYFAGAGWINGVMHGVPWCKCCNKPVDSFELMVQRPYEGQKIKLRIQCHDFKLEIETTRRVFTAPKALAIPGIFQSTITYKGQVNTSIGKLDLEEAARTIRGYVSVGELVMPTVDSLRTNLSVQSIEEIGQDLKDRNV